MMTFARFKCGLDFGVNNYKIHLNGKILDNSKEIYDEIWNAWICSDKYTYKHPWKPGDIMLMDQTTTIHRRPDVLKDKPRELLRTANWYKAEVRDHYNYVL